MKCFPERFLPWGRPQQNELILLNGDSGKDMKILEEIFEESKKQTDSRKRDKKKEGKRGTKSRTFDSIFE